MTNRTVDALSEEGPEHGVGMVNNARVGNLAESVGIVPKRQDADPPRQRAQELGVLDPWARVAIGSPGAQIIATQAMHKH